jgi:hypothetical protein
MPYLEYFEQLLRWTSELHNVADDRVPFPHTDLFLEVFQSFSLWSGG